MSRQQIIVLGLMLFFIVLGKLLEDPGAHDRVERDAAAYSAHLKCVEDGRCKTP